MHTRDFSDEALFAIQQGIRRGDPIANLEVLGAPLRILQPLMAVGIMSLEDLVYKTSEELLRVDSFGEVSLEQIYSALSRYHELEQVEELAPKMRQRISELESDQRTA